MNIKPGKSATIMKDLIFLTIKNESPKALATLIRILGDFNLAEDALQDALIKAVEH